MSTSTAELWVLEWHHESNRVHIQPVSRMVGMNRTRFAIDAPAAGRYAPIFIGTREQVEIEADKIRPILIKREEERVGA